MPGTRITRQVTMQRSAASARRGQQLARQRAAGVVAIPRTLRYNGQYSFTRNVTVRISTITTAGIQVIATNFPGIYFTFSPVDVTYYGSSAVFVTTPIPNAGDYSAMFDRIRIDKVEMGFMTNGDDLPYNAAATNPPIFYIANDYTDGTAGNILDQTREQEGCTVFKPTPGNSYLPYKWTMRSKFHRIVYFTALVSDYEPANNFVRAGVAIPHYGVRLAVDPQRLQTGSTDILIKMFFTVDNVK